MAIKVSVKFEPFNKQVAPLFSETPIAAVVTGARGGKTKLGCFASIMDAIEQPGYFKSDINDGLPYTMAIGAPTFPMLQRIILPTFLSMIPPELIIGKYHQTRKRLRVRGVKGESHVYFLSGNAFQSWMGMSLYRAWLDEFAQCREVLFDEVQVRLSDRKGTLRLTGTPQGPNWAFDRVYKPWSERKRIQAAGEVLDPDHPGLDIDFFTWRTVDNPWIDKTFIEHKQKTMPPRFFRRTFLATWETFEGQIYEEWLEAIHVKRREDFRFKLPCGRFVGNGERVVPLNRVVAGVDWGYAPGHAGVIIVGGQDTAGRWWLLEESVAEGVLVSADAGTDCWVTRARSLRVKWEIERFYCDTADPEAIAQFRRARLPAVMSIKDVKPGIETVSKYMHVEEDWGEPRMYAMDDLRTTIDELTYYHWLEGKEKPDKIADNTADAVRYMIHTQETKGRFRREPNYAPV